MPNWVYNGLTIEGNPDSVKKLMTQMNKPFVKLHDNWNSTTHQMEVKQTTYPNPVFAFHNIYNHTQAGISDEEYIAAGLIIQAQNPIQEFKMPTFKLKGKKTSTELLMEIRAEARY